jgi:hypothetical protein
MNDKLERMSKEVDVAKFKYYPRIFLEGLRNTVKYLSQYDRFPVWDLNLALSEYEASLPLRPVNCCVRRWEQYNPHQSSSVVGDSVHLEHC